MLKKKDKIKILIADKIDLSGIEQINKNFFSITFNFGISNSDILKQFKDFDVLVIRSVRKIDKGFLEKCNFKVIATCSKGLDHVDLITAKKRKIKIFYSESGNVVSAAEHTFALILEIVKRINYADKLIRNNNFSGNNFNRLELRGKKIGIIGFGKVGSRVARYAEVFDMVVFANDIDFKVRKKNKKVNFKSLNYILKNADIVTFHIPLNEKNKNFISREKLKLLNNKTILVNTSRGEILDERYLINLLKKKRIYFAGLDVFKNEPNINKSFFSLENVILTNHIAGKTNESHKYISKDIFMQVKNYFFYKQNIN